MATSPRALPYLASDFFAEGGTSLAGFSTKKFVVILFEAALSDYVARPKSLFPDFGIFELFRTDLADVAKHVGENGPERVKSLRLQLDP